MTINKITLSLIGFGLISLVFIMVAVYPLFDGIQQASRAFTSQRATLAEFEAKTKNLQDFKILRKTNEENLTKLAHLLIDSAEPVNFIEFLEKESSEHSLSIEIFPLAPQIAKDDIWPSMNFNLRLFGSSPDFLRFLEKLETSPYLIEVLSLNLRRLTESELKTEKFAKFSRGDIEAVLLIKVYTKK